MSDVKASVALTSDGRLQGFIGGSAASKMLLSQVHFPHRHINQG